MTNPLKDIQLLCEYTLRTIHSENFNSEGNQGHLNEVIGIQTEHFYDDQIQQAGFIVTRWTIDEINELILAGSIFYLLLNESKMLVGYIVISDIAKFTEQLVNAAHSFDFAQITRENEWRYIHQIGLASASTHKGIGTLLLDSLLKIYEQQTLVSDYMIRPRINLSSASLFEKKGFVKCGILDLNKYRGFGPSSWQIILVEQLQTYQVENRNLSPPNEK